MALPLHMKFQPLLSIATNTLENMSSTEQFKASKKPEHKLSQETSTSNRPHLMLNPLKHGSLAPVYI